MKNLILLTSILVFQFINGQIDPNGVLILNQGTTVEINAITPDEGALVYNTDDNKVYVFTGGAWVLTTGSNESWTVSGNNQYSAVSGNVGIGTTSPNEKIEVNGNAIIGSNNVDATLNGQGAFQAASNLNNAGFVATPWVYARAIEGDQRGTGATLITLGGENGFTNNDEIGFITNGTQRMHISSNLNGGNIGIGTTTPEQKLDVDGTIQMGDTGATNGVVQMVGKYSGINHINTYGSERSTGATVIGYAVQPKSGAAGYVSSAQNVAFRRGLLRNNGDLQFLTAASAQVNVGTDVTLTPRFTIKNAGNVGIGTASPNEKLEVNGSIRMTDGSEGAGKILVSDANGTGTWTDPSSVSDSDWTVSGNNQYSAVSGNVGIGTSSPSYKLDVREESTAAGIGTQEAINVNSTVAANATNNYGIYANTTPTATGTVTNNYSIFGDVNMPAGATATNTFGTYGRSLISGTVTANSYGVLGSTDILSGGSVTSTIRGGSFAARVRAGGAAAVAYGVLSSAQHEGNLSGSNYGTYSIARPLSGSSVDSNFGSYSNASILAGGTVNSSNYGTLNNADIFGTVSGSNFGSYNIARIRGGSLGTTNFGVYAHTGHIAGTLTGSNFGVYSYSPGDASSTVGTNYAGYFNADHVGNVTNNNFGIYSIARTRNGGSIGGNNYAGYFYGAASNSGGGGYGTIAGHNFGVRIIMSTNGVSGNTWGVYQTGNNGTENYFQNTVGINTTGGTGVLNVNGVATKTGGGVWAVFSDARSKENVKNYTKGLNELLQLRPVSFNYKKSFDFGSETHVGFIAQEVEKVVPSMVTTADMHDLKDFKQVDANEVTFMLINAVKELETENETLKTENEEMKKRLEAIEKALLKLQKK